jgi:hypothetical protein
MAIETAPQSFLEPAPSIPGRGGQALVLHDGVSSAAAQERALPANVEPWRSKRRVDP